MSKRVMKCPFRAALMRSIRGYHMHQRTGRVGVSVRQSHDDAPASSTDLYFTYLTSAVLKSEVLHRYLFMMNSYEDLA
jgi:hypothetical protein